jgi:hypothetical protein
MHVPLKKVLDDQYRPNQRGTNTNLIIGRVSRSTSVSGEVIFLLYTAECISISLCSQYTPAKSLMYCPSTCLLLSNAYTFVTTIVLCFLFTAYSLSL